MGIKVAKFGGSSLCDAEHFRKVKAIIQSDPDYRYVVPSAPGRRCPGDDKVTDLLYRCHRMAKAGEDLPQRSLLLNGYAEEDRLYISLADRDGAPLPEEALALRVRYPNGEVFSFMAEQGRLQLSRLPAGEYTYDDRNQC